MFGRQGQMQSLGRTPVGVIGVSGQEGVVGHVAPPPAEARLRARHLHQRQPGAGQPLGQCRGQALLRGRQGLQRDRQRQHAARGLFDAAVRILDQVVHPAVEFAGRRVLRKTHAHLGRVGGQCQSHAAGTELERTFDRRTPRDRHALDRRGHLIDHLAVLAQRHGHIGAAAFVTGDRQADEIGARLQGHGLAFGDAFALGFPFHLGRLVGLVEQGERGLGLIAHALPIGAGPFGVEILVGTHPVDALTDRAAGFDRAAGDAPARERLGHLEGEARMAARIGGQARHPGRGVDVVAARTFEHLDCALVDLTRRGQGAELVGREVVADEGQARAGAHIVAPRVVEKVVDGRRDLGLQHIDHFIDHADRHIGRDRLAGQRRVHVHGHGLARRIHRLVGLEAQGDARLFDHQALVLEHVIAMLEVGDRDRHVRAHGLAHRNTEFPLRGRQAFAAHPVGRLAEQGRAFDALAFEREQRVVDRFGEAHQRFGGVTGAIARAVEDDADAARGRLDAFARDPMRGGADDAPARIAQVERVRARLREGQRDAVAGAQGTGLTGAVFEADPFPLRGRCGIGDARVALARREVEGDRFAGLRELTIGAELVARAAALDQDFLRGPHAVGRAIGGQRGQHITARLGRGRQAEPGDAARIGIEFALRELERELAGVIEFAIDHRQLLGTRGQHHMRMRDGLAVGVVELDLAVDRFVEREVGLVGLDQDFEMRLLIIGHAEGGGVNIVAHRKAQFITARNRVLGQGELRIATVRAVQMQALRADQSARRIVDRHRDLGVLERNRIARAAEFASADLDLHHIAGPVQRPVGHGVDLGRVNLGVVIEVLGNEHAAGRIEAEHISLLGRLAIEAHQALRIGIAALEHADAVGPDHAGLGHRRAIGTLGREHQHLVARDLGQRHGVGNEQQGGGAMLAADRFDHVQTGRALAERHIDIARRGGHEFTAAAFELEVLGRRDRLGHLQRVTETIDDRQARDRLEARRLFEGGRFGQVRARAEVGRMLDHRLACVRREQTPPRDARLDHPAVPQMGQHIRQAVVGRLGIDLHAMQVLLLLQEGERIGHAVDDHIDAAHLFERGRLIELEAHGRVVGAAVGRIRQQEERLAHERTARIRQRHGRVGRLHLGPGGGRCGLGLGGGCGRRKGRSGDQGGQGKSDGGPRPRRA